MFENLFSNLLTLDTLFTAIIFVVSISLHEFAHAYSSYKLWDPTPQMQGRLTPDPRKHIDIIWFVLIFLIGFWWGRAVQINPSYYKNPYKDELIVALAGPATNILLGIIAIIVMVLYIALTGENFASLWGSQNLVLYFWMKFSLLNFALAAFNMIPLPPLDGYRLIKVVNHKAWARLENNIMRISMGFLLLVVFGPFSHILTSYISGVAEWLFRIFTIPVGSIFF